MSEFHEPCCEVTKILSQRAHFAMNFFLIRDDLADRLVCLRHVETSTQCWFERCDDPFAEGIHTVNGVVCILARLGQDGVSVSGVRAALA